MPDRAGQPPPEHEIADRLAITDILNSHCRGLDRLDLPLLQSCYWPEAEVNYGSYKGPALTFAELVLPALQGQYELTRHCISNTLFTLRDQRAFTESYVNAGHLLLGAGEEMQFSGRYLDTLEKRNNQWKLLHRQVVMDWSRRHAVVDERNSDAFADLEKGRSDTEDYSYRHDTRDDEEVETE